MSSSASIVTLIALATFLSPFGHAQVPSNQKADLRLTLECIDSTRIAFAIRNDGETDTALRLGSAVGNGLKYTIDDLQLRQKTPSGQVSENHYWPRRYPSVIGGSLGEWIQAIPARSAFIVTAEATDFWRSDDLGRVTPFGVGVELSLRLTILAPRPQAMLLASWNGTLTSNSCIPP
jgi:hypothetical protein